jgi:hypothetical protein
MCFKSLVRNFKHTVSEKEIAWLAAKHNFEMRVLCLCLFAEKPAVA